MLFLGVLGVSDHAGPCVGSRSIAARRCCLLTDWKGSAPGFVVFEAQYPARRCLCLRFAHRLAAASARLEVRTESLLLSCRALSSPTNMPVYPGAPSLRPCQFTLIVTSTKS